MLTRSKFHCFIITISLTLFLLKSIFAVTGSGSKITKRRFRTKPKIAIVQFEDTNEAGEKLGLGKTITAIITTSFVNRGNFTVVGFDKIKSILSERNLKLKGLSTSMIESIKRKFKIEVLLTGKVSYIKNAINIDIYLQLASTGKVLIARSAISRDTSNLRSVVGKLAFNVELDYLRPWLGKISLISHPAGAEVYLNDIYYGKTTSKPFIIDNFIEGKYKLKLILGGYKEWLGEIVVLPKLDRTIKVTLTPHPGSLNIYSDPKIADVYIDNHYYGKTPLQIGEISEGAHLIVVKKENYQNWEREVVVKSFQPTDVEAKLKVSPGSLYIESEPPEAAIYFKGNYINDTPFTLRNLTPGEIVINLSKKGYKELAKSVTIIPSRKISIKETLEPMQGFLSITTKPGDASIFLDDKEIGKSPLFNRPLLIGSHYVQIIRGDYYPVSKRVYIKDGEETELNLRLKRKPGSIFIETEPKSTSVYLDNDYKGRTPLEVKNLEENSYKVEIVSPLGKKITNVMVKPDKVTRIKKKMRKKASHTTSASLIWLSILGILGLVLLP